MIPGAVLAGRYTLARLIGSGGMGRVWVARDAVLDREVAVKTVALVPGEDEVTFARFQFEARATASLSHPNVVTIYDSGTDGSTAFLVMELLPGPSVADVPAERGPLPLGEVVALAEQVASGLAAAHAAGVIHRDIKPANLVFDADGAVKIVDFGIARLAQATTSHLTEAHTVLGSAPYLSPELINGGPADERSDLYSLGCVLMTMLTGSPPFHSEHLMGLLSQQASADPPRLRDRLTDVDPDLDQLVSELLSKSPADRPATADAVLARLQRIPGSAETGTPVPRGSAATAVRPSPTRILPTEPTALPSARPGGPTPASARSSARHRGGAVLALAALALAVLVAVIIRWSGSDGAPAQDAQPSVAASALTSAPAAAASEPDTQASSDVGSPASTTDQALAQLHVAVATAASSAELQENQVAELQKRVDDLARHVSNTGNKDLGRQIETFEKYLEKLTEKGELSQAGRQRIQGPLSTLQR